MLVSFLASYANACDVCGCAVNAGGADVVPGVFQNYIGFRSNIRSFNSEHLILFEGEKPIQSKEWFQTSELHFRYSPIRRLQLFGFVPFNSVDKLEEGVKSRTGGIGDARIRLNWVAIDRIEYERNEYANVFLGTSLKLPTGRNEFREGESSLFHRNMLPGTGTVDVAFHLDAMMRRGNLGGLWSSTYMVRGTNEFQYQFGNLTVSQLTGFYKKEFSENTLMLELGVNFVDMQPDVDLRWNEVQIYSQGTMLSPLIRTTFMRNNWLLQATAHRAAWQNMAQGQVSHNYHFEIGLTYLFN